MIRFDCDYAEGMHPAILDALIKTNEEQTPGYGVDTHCEHARELIKKACHREDVDVHFLVGGTQTNATIIAAGLRPYQGVLSATTGHINVHETGAIESYGHKVLPLPSEDGKITAAQISEAWETHIHDGSFEHMVQPGMVYISQPTENGTLYSRKELQEISDVCRRAGLYLFVDGARCGYGLMAEGNDVMLPDLATLADVFYIGGTKVGAMFGEAVVITNPALKKDFRYFIKQHGAMLAKGRLLGIQYEVLFTDDLYEKIALHADKLAMDIRHAFESHHVSLLYDSITNQQYPILTDEELAAFSEKYAFSFWCKTDAQHSAVRVCTSWATKEEHVNALLADIDRICKR